MEQTTTSVSTQLPAHYETTHLVFDRIQEQESISTYHGEHSKVICAYTVRIKKYNMSFCFWLEEHRLVPTAPPVALSLIIRLDQKDSKLVDSFTYSQIPELHVTESILTRIFDKIQQGYASTDLKLFENKIKTQIRQDELFKRDHGDICLSDIASMIRTTSIIHTITRKPNMILDITTMLNIVPDYSFPIATDNTYTHFRTVGMLAYRDPTDSSRTMLLFKPNYIGYLNTGVYHIDEKIRDLLKYKGRCDENKSIDDLILEYALYIESIAETTPKVRSYLSDIKKTKHPILSDKHRTSR